MTAGIEAASRIASALNRPLVLVLGDMLRLGSAEERWHHTIGALSASHCNFLVTRGIRASIYADAAVLAGLSSDCVAVTHTAGDAAQQAKRFALADPLQPALIYIKGSEEIRMEQVTELLLASPDEAETKLVRQTQAWRRVTVMRPDPADLAGNRP